MTSMTTWTIAYRKPRANRFVRPTNFAGTWAQAKALASVFAERHPELQVYYVSSRESELAGNVIVEDIANVLVDSGKRVRIVEQGEVEADLIARVPSDEVAQQRWLDGVEIPNPAPAVELSTDEAESMAASLLTSIDGEPAREQVRAWWVRHGLDRETSITAAMVLGARDGDQLEAQRMNAAR